MEKIERHISYDLRFDGYDVDIYRISRPGKMFCSNPFRWHLKIWTDYGPEGDLGEVRRAVGKRFKAAKSNASIKSIQTSIEKVFGLPRGSVQLITPEKRPAGLKSKVKSLRDLWKTAQST